jgi:hypothetical protein
MTSTINPDFLTNPCFLRFADNETAVAALNLLRSKRLVMTWSGYEDHILRTGSPDKARKILALHDLNPL